jgi:plasmid stability protein
MASITIRNFDESLKRKLKARATLNGRSMQAEAPAILASYFPTEKAEDAPPTQGLGTAIHNLFAPIRGVELKIPPRRNSRRLFHKSE